MPTVELSKDEMYRVRNALIFAGQHHDGWEGRAIGAQMQSLSERFEEAWREA